MKQRIFCCLCVLLLLAPSLAWAEVIYDAETLFPERVATTCKIETNMGAGTGFFYEPYVVATANHVIAEASEARIQLSNGAFFEVTGVLAADERLDLALLQVNCKGTVAPLNTHPVREGMPLYTIGNPQGLYPCITAGHVMKASHNVDGVDRILADMNTLGGNSGGPVFNKYGEVCAIVNGGFIDGVKTWEFFSPVEALQLLDRMNPVSLTEIARINREKNAAKDDPVHYNNAALADAVTGDTVYFGSYEQDNDFSNGAEPIEWIVTDADDGTLTLISRYCLDAMLFYTDGECTWETSDVRRFLNQDFLAQAFNEEEQSRILTTTVPNNPNPAFGTDCGPATEDRVFLPSIQELMEFYGVKNENNENIFTDAYVIATPYAISKGIWLEIGGSSRCWIWTRTMGANNHQACELGSLGYFSLDGAPVNNPMGGSRGLRPVIRISRK